MPMRAPRLCKCGNRVAFGARCPCEQQADRERKARHDVTRPSSSARGYNRAWEKERAAFLKVNRHCRRCGRIATVVDHRLPHRGAAALFWDRDNWQALCASCHSGTKQREERRGEKEGLEIASFAAGGARIFISPSIVEGEWREVTQVERVGTARTPGRIEIVLRRDNADLGQAILSAAAFTEQSERAFRFVMSDGAERRFMARVVAVREAPGRLRSVLAISGDVERHAVAAMAEAS